MPPDNEAVPEELPVIYPTTPEPDIAGATALPADLLEDTTLPSGSEDSTAEDVVYPPISTEDLDKASPTDAGMLPLSGVSVDELQALYEARVNQMGGPQFLTQAAIPGTYENLLWFSLRNYSGEADRIQDSLAAISDKSRLLNKLEENGKTILGHTRFRARPAGAVKVVSGDAGIVEMLSTRKGQIARVMLYNSGFSIDIRCPSPDDLHTLLRRSHADIEEYGRDFGGHFYAYADIILKKNFIDMVIALTIGASLKDWKKPGTLIQFIRLPDYDVIMTLMAALMYPDGYPDFRHICTRPVNDPTHPGGCSHVSTVTADLTKLVLTNFLALNDKAVAHMVKARIATEPLHAKTIEAYQSELGFDGTLVTFDDYQFTMVVPTLADYLLAGEAFNADLLDEIAANNRKEIYDAIAFRDSRIYLPWIKRVAHLDENGEPNLISEDKKVIASVLDMLAADSVKQILLDKFIDFINKSKLSNVGYPVFACPACGYTPATPSGYFTVDPQHSFFIQSVRYLQKT